MGKKQIVSIILAMCMLVGSLSGSVAYAANENTSTYDLPSDLSIIFPKERVKQAKDKGYDVKYSQYKPSRYTLEYIPKNPNFYDISGQLTVQKNSILHDFNNLFWQVLLVWDFTVITALENSFSLDIVNWFADAVERAIQQLAGFNGQNFDGKGIWGNFLLLFIICGGAYIAYLGMIQKKTTNALNAMVKSLVILILAMAFFANSGSVMRYLNDLSSGLSEELMGVGFELNDSMNEGVKYSNDVASFVVADKIYQMMIYQPYLMLQYGKTNEDKVLTKERILKLLKARPDSAERKEVLKGESNNVMMSDTGVSQRVVLLCLLGISHCILGFVFFIIAGAMLVYQFLFVIFALYAPFALLMALYPTWSEVAMNWLKKFVGFQLTKLLLGIFLSVLVTMSQFLYGMAPPEKAGYIWTIAMQLILVLGIIWKRKELFSILSTPMKASADGSIRDLVKKLDGYLGNTSQRIRKYTTRS